MNSLRTAASLALAAALGGIPLVTFGAPSASAAAGCSTRGCASYDPYAESCTAASSITKTYTSGAAVATVVNEYSSVCKANWVFAYENTSAQNAGWTLSLSISTTDSSGASESMCGPSPILETDPGSANIIEVCRGTYGGATGWPMWTDMVDGTNKSYATLKVFSSAGKTIASVSDPQ
ncbi:hypothetical protein [Actinospica robiniae]|uniref:hypothetical protein n=1 Tax=Actinospica robiniae TaxID=304901 RepID=UPI000414DDBE|nr:hypothetical protein [Actinospica robiniae]